MCHQHMRPIKNSLINSLYVKLGSGPGPILASRFGPNTVWSGILTFDTILLINSFYSLPGRRRRKEAEQSGSVLITGVLMRPHCL